MDCGGRTRRREAVKSDGLFPRYQGKTCFSDKTLRELAVAWPQTIEEFRAVSGVGDAKAARYGKAFLAEIDRFSR